jgi:hypothetical protein
LAFLKLPAAKVHCTSGVAESSKTSTEAATIDVGQYVSPVDEKSKGGT